LEQILFAYRHGAINEACDYLLSLDDDKWHMMGKGPAYINSALNNPSDEDE